MPNGESPRTDEMSSLEEIAFSELKKTTEANPQVPQEEQRRASIEIGKAKEQEHQKAEKSANGLLQRNGIPTEKEAPKTMEEFFREIINVEKQVTKNQEIIQTEAKEKLTKTATPFSDDIINNLILTFNDQFIQANKDKFTDQSDETKNKIITLYSEQLKTYLTSEIDKKIAEYRASLRDLESSFDQRQYTTFESYKTTVSINEKKQEVSVTVILKEVPKQFSPTKLLDAYIKKDQNTLTKYQQMVQEIYQSYGLTGEEAKQETKKLYEKQVQEFEKEIARRDDLQKKVARLEAHRKAIEGLEGADLLRYARAVQGDQAAYEELKNNEKTKSLVSQFEERKREAGSKALDLKTRDETNAWEETMTLTFESHGNFSATVLKNTVALDYRAFATDDPIRCVLKRDNKLGLVLTPDLEHEFWEAKVQNPFFDQRSFGPKPVASGEEILKTIKDYKKVLEFQIILHRPGIFDQLSGEEKEDLREIFSNPENCLRIMSFVEDHYAKFRPERSLNDMLKEIFEPIFEKLHKPPENFLFNDVPVALDEDHIIKGSWFDKDGSILEANLERDFETIADYHNRFRDEDRDH